MRTVLLVLTASLIGASQTARAPSTEGAPGFGRPDAAVVVVVFSDFECPYCRQEVATLRKSLPTAYPTQVRVHFKDAPAEAHHPWAKAAAMAGRCVYRQSGDAFWRYHDWIFDHQPQITPQNLGARVMEWAQGEKGLDTIQLTRCIETKATEGDVEKSLAEARGLGVTKLPTMFVNRRRIEETVDWDRLRAIIDGEMRGSRRR